MEEIRVKLWLRVESSSKSSQDKRKARQSIEDFILYDYGLYANGPPKFDKKGGEYELTINYNTEEELNNIIGDILCQIEMEGEIYDCFTEVNVSTQDGSRSW